MGLLCVSLLVSPWQIRPYVPWEGPCHIRIFLNKLSVSKMSSFPCHARLQQCYLMLLKMHLLDLSRLRLHKAVAEICFFQKTAFLLQLVALHDCWTRDSGTEGINMTRRCRFAGTGGTRMNTQEISSTISEGTHYRRAKCCGKWWSWSVMF